MAVFPAPLAHLALGPLHGHGHRFALIFAFSPIADAYLGADQDIRRSEEHTSELQSHSDISYAVFCLKKIFFFFNDTATTEIYTLSLHDALPISNRSNGLPGMRYRRLR